MHSIPLRYNRAPPIPPVSGIYRQHVRRWDEQVGSVGKQARVRPGDAAIRVLSRRGLPAKLTRVWIAYVHSYLVHDL